MRIGEVCTRDVVVCTPDTSVTEVAKLMRDHHVGSLVIVEERDGRRLPIGVVTDRDLVVEVLAPEAPIEKLTAGDIRGIELVTINESDDVYDALDLMRRKGIRRIPVVDAQGALAGIAALDDLLEILSEELGIMVKLISRERYRETETRPPLAPGVAPARH